MPLRLVYQQRLESLEECNDGGSRTEFPFMSDECANKSAPTPPRCPSCAQPMKLVRRTPRVGGLSELYTLNAERVACRISRRHDNDCHHTAADIGREVVGRASGKLAR
jgi:hypothetical protein